MSREAMKMALDALETPHPSIRTDFSDAMVYRENVKAAIEALRAALAQHDEQIDIKGAEMNTNRSGNLHEVMHQAAWDSATRVPEGDIRVLKHRIHELEGEVIGYKQILDTQPEPEPHGYLQLRNAKFYYELEGVIDHKNYLPLYIALPQRKPLTEEEMIEIMENCTYDGGKVSWNLFGKAIEAAHGIG